MTQTLLRIDASVRTEGSTTRRLADDIQNRLNADHVVTRDLSEGLPLLDAAWVGANFTPDENRTADQRATLALSDALVEEVKRADTLLITVPVYNFSVPAGLKAWVDLVARAGVTFRYTETGPVGLLEGKRAILAVASGGTEVDGPMDFATPWLRHVLGFMGITDVQVVRSDRQMVDAAASEARAAEDLEKLAA